MTRQPFPTCPPPAVPPPAAPSVWTDRERHAHVPPPCPVCGDTTDQVWVRVLSQADDPGDPDVRQWVRAWAECPTHGDGEGDDDGE